MRVTEIGADHVIAGMPPVVPTPSPNGEFDVLLCAAGFEDRAVHITSLLDSPDLSFKTAVVLDYRTNLEDNASRRRELIRRLEGAVGRVHLVDDECTEAEFDGRVGELIPDGAKVMFDISAATGTYILRVLRALFLRARTRQVSLTVLYSSAAEYTPTKPDAEALIELTSQSDTAGVSTFGLDHDADEVPQVIAAGGVHLDAVTERAVVICGFNADRVRASLDKIDTSFNLDIPHPNVSYIAGVPPRPADLWRYKAMKDINQTPDARQASTLHYAETMRLLEEAHSNAGYRSRLTVLPFGSKLQSLAVALFSEAHSDARIQMLAPVRYAGAGYSRGIGEVFTVTLGDLRFLSSVLRSIGSLRIQEHPDRRPRTTAVILTPSEDNN